MIGLLAAAALVPHLTPDGWGAVKIGMTSGQVERVLHLKLEGGEDFTEDANACIERNAAGRLSGIVFMFENRRLSRISIWQPSLVSTPRGIGVGASTSQVERAYRKGLRIEPHQYEDLPAQYLTYWTIKGRRGVRFETDSKRQIRVIHAGTSAIQYIEGCS